LTFDHDPRRVRLYVKTGSFIVVGLVIFVLGMFLITPVASWLVKTLGWVIMISGAVIFATGIGAALRSRR